MSWLIDDPSPLIYLTVFVQLVLLGALIRTRRVAVIGIMVGVFALLGVALFVDYLVVTDRELVAELVYEMAAAAEANDETRLLATMADDARDLRGDASRLLKMVKISEVDILAGPEVIVDELMSPPSATATFTAQGKGKSSQFAGRHIAKLTLHFDKIDDRWVATQSEQRLPFSR